MTQVSRLRIDVLSDRPPHDGGHYVLYWVTTCRRTGWNFGLQRAVHWARELAKPLVILEALRCDYPWASDRLHRFLIQGMADNARSLAKRGALYYPYVEPTRGAGKGLVAALAAQAAVVIGDDYPCFFLPHMHRAATAQIPVRFELIDSNGLLPLRAAPKAFARAVDFRRFLQRTLRDHLDDMPEPDPLARVRIPRLAELPSAIRRRWPAAALDRLVGSASGVAALPINHAVPPAPQTGGARAAQRSLRSFLTTSIARYGADRNQPSQEITSGLSPYLHAGHIAAHQVFWETMAHAGWNMSQLGQRATGSAAGWWGTSAQVESFLDQLVTWREIGFNLCHHRVDYDQYLSLPAWARDTLAQHLQDPRSHVYGIDRFEAADTHDPLWNAAQRQLAREGRIHNYLRMLWGKKVLQWTRHPQDALAILIELNNKYALDGRDPNSYSGICWCLGRYDRPWGPERPVFGKIRYMSSRNTARKLRLAEYLARYGA